jgi:hypothetical protein
MTTLIIKNKYGDVLLEDEFDLPEAREHEFALAIQALVNLGLGTLP